MRGRIEQKELNKLPHIDVANIGDRIIMLMAVWDGQVWSQWINDAEGKLFNIHAVDVVHASYLAKSPARESDIFVGFIDFIWQRASWPEMVPLLRGICDDFHVMAACAAKLEHLHNTRDLIDHALVSSFVKTELEYLIIVARSVFDLLQEAVACFWNGRVTLLDPDAEAIRKRRKLPPTFSKVVFDGNISRTAQQITERFALPIEVSTVYEKHIPFFKRCALHAMA